MLTTGETGVNAGGPTAPPRTVMMSVAQLAQRYGVSKPAISRKVKQLRELGLQVELDGQGRVTAVHAVQYEELRARVSDPSKQQAPSPPVGLSAAVATSETYDEALRQKTWHEAERLRIKLAAERGELVDRAKLVDALALAGERIVRATDLIMASTDDLAAAVAREGAGGVRLELKKLAHRIKNEIADALASVAADAPETEPEET